MTKTRQLLSLLAVAASSVSLLAVQAGVAQDSPIDDPTPVTDEMLNNPPDGDWLMWRRTYNGWGYSPLDEINKDNVGDLELAWAWACLRADGRRKRPSFMTEFCISRTRAISSRPRRGHGRVDLGV